MNYAQGDGEKGNKGYNQIYVVLFFLKVRHMEGELAPKHHSWGRTRVHRRPNERPSSFPGDHWLSAWVESMK